MEEEVRRQTTPDRRIADRSAWMLLDPKYMVEFRLLNAFKRATQLWRGHYETVNKKLDSTLRRVLKFDIIAEIIHPLINFGVNIYFLDMLINKTRGFDLGDFIFLRGSLEATLRSAYISTEVARRLHQTSINIHNFNEIYETEPAIDDGEVRVSLPLQIEFKNVSFKYRDQRTGFKRHFLQNPSRGALGPGRRKRRRQVNHHQAADAPVPAHFRRD